MAENLLIHVLLGEIRLEVLFEWIKRRNSDIAEIDSELTKFRCSQADFLSYFLNYIHDEAPCSNASNEPVPKALLTTKSVVKKQDTEESVIIKRWPALFSDNDKQIANSEVNFSTPKSAKTHSSHILNRSNMSPVSPLYSNVNFNTPVNKKLQNSEQKSADRNLCLGDFIINKNSSGRKKVQKNLNNLVQNESNKKSRRINPTKLGQKRLSNTDNFQKLENSFNFQNDFVELCVDNSNEQRSLLVEERTKIASEIKSDDVMKLVNSYNFENVIKTEMKADCKLVTQRKELDLLSEIYGYLLKNNLVLNLTSELYFLILLLSNKHFEGDCNESTVISTHVMLTSDEINLLITNSFYLKTLLKAPHNSVYFAAKTLSLLVSVLHFLDKSVIKLLIENETIKRYSQDINLMQILSELYDHKVEHITGSIESIHANNVCFVLDTDNRENFPTDASFHAFRKQRDLFYEILRIWEQNHCMPGWSFPLALGGKIKSLLNLYNDSVNFTHFTRLFKAQLLTTCGNCSNEEGMTENEMSFLSSIPNVDADKLCRLKSRLVTKHITDGINTSPQFTGQQEFYKEFIVVSSLHVFHVHLRDSLILDILELNDSKFCDGDFNDAANLDLNRSAYLTCIKSLRILAKFLGFIESLPYKIDCKILPDKVLTAEIKTRQWLHSIFDLTSIITNAIRNKTLVLTIPWLVNYLSMLDYVTLRLPYYKNIILKLLFSLHLNCTSPSILSDVLIKLCLGWLFELQHFPSDLYFQWYSADETEIHGSLKRLQEKSLDDSDIVDSNVIYTCCPYLDEIKKPLIFNNSSSNNSVIKHITPISAVDSPAEISEKKLKAQLEEAFFSGQPVSVRKTVEFVSERIASACVKYICNSIVPDSKKSLLSEFKNADAQGETYALLKAKADSCAQVCLKALQDKCAEVSEKMIRERIPTSIVLLLADDDLVQMKETCSTIAMRMCSTRIQQWMNSHINLGIFSSEIQKIATNHMEQPKDKPAIILPSGGREVIHNPNTFSAVELVEIIRKLSLDILDRNPNFTLDHISSALESAKVSIQERCDINDNILSVINKMLVDLYLLILTHHCDIASETSILVKFVEHWKMFSSSPNEDLFKSVLSPRNVMLLAQSRDVKKSWQALAKFLISLIKNGLLTSEVLESHCVMVYQNEWDEETLKLFAACFRDIVDEFAHGEVNKNFSYLLSFISGFCSDMDVL